MTAERYLRHSLIDWFSQEDVQASSFAVVGCGAVGNEVLKNLALLGVGSVDLFDFDTIEIHNLTRSVLFSEEDVGFNKADVAAKRLKQIDPNIEVNAFTCDFWDVLSFDMVRSYDCVICCVDNFEARIRLNQLCLIGGVDLINTGIDSKFSQIEIFPFSGESSTACYECNLPSSAYERLQSRYSCGWLKKVSYVEKKIPTTIITSSLAGALAASNALNFVKGDSQDYARRILIESFTGKSTVSEIQKSGECPACSSVSGNVVIVKGSAVIKESFLFSGIDANLVTSEPILVSHRCVKCQPDEGDSTIVFEKASSYNSDLTICAECQVDSVDVTISDSFSVSELVEKYSGMRIPAKFIRVDTDGRTLIIELE